MFLQSEVQANDECIDNNFVLKSQLYTVLKDRTMVDRELDMLRLKGEVRILRIASGVTDSAVLLRNQYRSEIIAAMNRARGRVSQQVLSPCKGVTAATLSHPQTPLNGKVLPTKPTGQIIPSSGALCGGLVEALEGFLQGVAGSYHEVSIDKRRLLALMTQGLRATRPQVKAMATDNHITLLLNAGFVARDPVSDERLLLSSPSLGVFVTNLVRGRMELISLVQRKKYGEVFQKEIMKRKKLTHSSLPLKFHIRDLVALGRLEAVTTTSGVLLRCRNKGPR